MDYTMSLQILLSLALLGVASLFDLRSREVPNLVWVAFLPPSLVVTALDLYQHPEQLSLVVISIALTTGISLTIFYLGLYGGADAKALITLAVAHPVTSIPPLQTPLLPLTTFTNSLLLMLVVAPVALIKNIQWIRSTQQSLFHGLNGESVWRKLAALFLCVKVSKATIQPYHIIAERRVTEGDVERRTLQLFHRIEDEDAQVDDSIPDDVFIVYSLPMLPFILIAYIVTLTVGDLVFHLLATIL
jgi:preflagellin peptidase FlaK